jgi:hypothetical protein
MMLSSLMTQAFPSTVAARVMAARPMLSADAPLDLGANLEQLKQDLDMLHVGLTIGFIFGLWSIIRLAFIILIFHALESESESLCSSVPFSLGVVLVHAGFGDTFAIHAQ